MTSIYQQALGTDFNRLHPKIQQRFGFCSKDRLSSIGRGIMSKVGYEKRFILPFLHLGRKRHILFPRRGTNIPFSVQNYAYLDTYGRETVSWIRSFRFPREVCRFDANMIFCPERKCMLDYLGTHQHLAVDIELSVSPERGMQIVSGEQRFYEGWFGFRFPMAFSGQARVKEWYDEKQKKFRISVGVFNRFFGKLFGYEGCFDVVYRHVQPSEIPLDIRPLRVEKRV